MGLNGNRRSRDYELPIKEFLKRAEKEYLAAVLQRTRGGISASAKHAMIDAATLHRKMKIHGMRRDEFTRPPGGVGPGSDS